ncbi:hypothetical protein [Nocardia sp. NPDC058666]|uniref:hypothetical protein n=1 Tax=unclassified Nocardia TaxID=2637762 RepID=UPI00365F3532
MGAEHADTARRSEQRANDRGGAVVGDTDNTGRGLVADSAFWQAATIAVPAASVMIVTLFGFLARLADAAYPSLDVSQHLVYGILTAVVVVVAGCLIVRRTARTLGAAVGTAVPGILLTLSWVASI